MESTTKETLPTGTLTFLFTDIEGSTRLAQTLGERFDELLSEHHRILRESFASHGGVEISTEGDAFFVVFTDAAQAVVAAAAAQRALAEHEWSAGEPVRVRMGMHTGRGQLVGDNYGGLDVHLTARVSSAAHGGQVLLTEATKVLVAEGLDDGIAVRPLGSHRLKDFDRQLQIYQLDIEGLQVDFPTIRTLAARPNNLPTQLSPFVGRDREVEEIRELLSKNRLVTLTGPGGTGKTRLSLEVAARCLHSFENGVCVAFLAPVVDPSLVPSEVARNLGLRATGLRPIGDVLRDHLRDAEMLLILDNFEQVLDAAPFVADLLAAAPRVKILATSRAALRVTGEQECPVPPMAVADPKRLPPLETLGHYEAIELFLQSARAIKPDLMLTDENAGAIAEICWRLEGLPLAVELAAARVRLLSPQQISERLDQSLTLLKGGGRDRPTRQQTLRDAIAWSYDLLAPESQALFQKLGVFSGGWTLDAAELVCTGDMIGVDVFEGLEELVANSLVRGFEDDLGESRFRMLGTIRDFAVEQLQEAGRYEAVREAHAHYFLSMVEELAPRITLDQVAVARLNAEHDNVRAALRWFLDREDAEDGLRVGSSLWRFWQIKGFLSEGRDWIDRFLALPGGREPTALRAQGLLAGGSLAYWQFDYGCAKDFYTGALGIYESLGDEAGKAEAMFNVGFAGLVEQDWGFARPYHEESLALFELLADASGVMRAKWALGMGALQEADLDNARRFGSEVVAAAEEAGDWFWRGTGEFILLQADRFSGDFKSALERALSESYLRTFASDLVALSSLVEVVAAVAIKTGEGEVGVRLAGAAERFKEDAEGGAPPALIQAEDVRELALASLPQEEVDRLWDEGRSLTPEGAIALALKLKGSL
jgi:predicted ATPase/class 3 adenylate cyclase